MAGYREFQTGEVLTAANVNSFLMEQATMTFADAAARDAALAGVLREGLLTYNLDTNRLEVYDGTDWIEPAPEPPAGIGSNVVQTVKDDVFSTTSLTYVVPTGLTLSFTPSSATSKVLLIASVPLTGTSGSSDRAVFVSMFADGNNLSDPDSLGTRTPIFGAVGITTSGTQKLERQALVQTMVFLHSPATISAVTYDVRVRGVSTGDTVIVNRTDSNVDSPVSARGVASITAIEVAA